MFSDKKKISEDCNKISGSVTNEVNLNHRNMKLTEVEHKEQKTWSGNYGYFGLSLIGVLMFIISHSMTMTIACFLLSMAFEPFNGKPYRKWTKWQKGAILAQLAVFAFITGVYLYTVVKG